MYIYRKVFFNEYLKDTIELFLSTNNMTHSDLSNELQLSKSTIDKILQSKRSINDIFLYWLKQNNININRYVIYNHD